LGKEKERGGVCGTEKQGHRRRERGGGGKVLEKGMGENMWEGGREK
jgi:hypothetical protein